MLTIKCAYCKQKLFKYLKIGQGKVLRCHKKRVKKYYVPLLIEKDIVKCPNCKSKFAKNEDTYFDMIRDGFIYTGRKIRK